MQLFRLYLGVNPGFLSGPMCANIRIAATVPLEHYVYGDRTHENMTQG